MNRFIVVDLETTGNHPDHDHIIQAGAVLIEDGDLKKVYSSYVRTNRDIPFLIQKLTGITPEMVRQAPRLDEVMMELLPLLENSVFVAHNAAFDLGFIQAALERLGYVPFSGLIIDTVQLARILYPTAQSYKLEHITDELMIELEKPHRADEDALATAKLFLTLLKKLKKMPLIYLQRLTEIIQKTDRDLYFLIENVKSEKILHYEEETEHIIFNQLALQMDKEEEMETDSDSIGIPFESLFAEEGLLYQQFPDFEWRPAQKEMAEEVIKAFADQAHLMVEAGTGTGKSLAYLLPSLYWAKDHQVKVVIATHTINLQEQLFQRDIPLLKKILPFDFSATLLKGRNNYLCLRKFEQSLQQHQQLELTKEEAVFSGQILTWVAETKTGDIEEMNLSVSGQNLWQPLKSDADTCLNRKCPWFRSCFYHRAKQKAQTSDIIITNHSLLLTNLKAEHRILPAYQHLVIDEAHQFEEVASKHLGFEISQYQFLSLLQRLYKDAKNGFLVMMMNELLQSQNPDQFDAANQIKNHVVPVISRLEGDVESYFQILGQFVDSMVHHQETGRKVLRIISKVKKEKEWVEIAAIHENIYIELTEILNGLEETFRKLKNLDLEENILADLNGYVKEIKELMFSFSEWNLTEDLNQVFWVETSIYKKKYASFLYGSPVEIGPYIKEVLFDQLDSVVLTSATLSVNHSFDYASREFGFDPDDGNLRKVKLDSPFDYKEQSMVYIPQDVPDIREVSEGKYIEHLAHNIADIAVSFNGRTLVLFTSHKMLQNTYELVKKRLEPYQIKVLGHGIDSNSRSKLIKSFTNHGNAILFGTNSFWEGVDIPGDALSALIIVRLPFTPPNHPIHEAKTERLKTQRMNPFMSFSVPQAVIRFKQGFGRLIRTKKDRGIVVVFDRRIMESRYGTAFIQSLPTVGIKYIPFTSIMSDIEKWAK